MRHKSWLICAMVTCIALVTIAQDRNPSQEPNPNVFLDQNPNTGLIQTTHYFDDAELDSFILKTMDDYQMVGFAALIVQDTQIVWTGNYGYANIEENQEVIDSTLFMLASISKTITATALMQLWEQDLFELDDNINAYLPPELQVVNPYYPSDSITFTMLLTHTSSINDNWDVIDDLYVQGDSPISLDSFLVDYLMPDGAYYSASQNFNPWNPGSQFDYCNVAFDLIGYLVETISGIPFPQYCQEHIFNPLGMTETSWLLAGLDTSKIAIPYKSDGTRYFAIGHYGYPDYPSGQLRTSTQQLANFLTAYMQNGKFKGQTILDSTTVDSIFTERIFDPRPERLNWFGLCWWTDEINDKWLWGHMGGDYGVSTAMFHSPEEKWGFINFTNCDLWDYSWDARLMIPRELAQFADIYYNVYAHETHVDFPFMQTGSDTLSLATEFVNRKAHAFTTNAIIISLDSTYIDSIPLYDDGGHHDGEAGDGIWGNQILPISDEHTFSISVSSLEAITSEYFCSNDAARFTTIGPVVFDHYETPTPSWPGDEVSLRLALRNEGSSAVAPDISVRIITDMDSLITVLSNPVLVFGDIPPGSESTSNILYTFRLSENFPGGSEITFDLSITCGEYAFWSDKFHFPVFPRDIGAVTVTTPYVEPGSDSVAVTAFFSGDTTGLRIFAELESPDQTPLDTIRLYDDGIHQDGAADDSLFANIWPVLSTIECLYFVDLEVTLMDADTVNYYWDNATRFTTIGPVGIHSWTTPWHPDPPRPGDDIYFALSFHNEGSTATATDITAVVIPENDTLVTTLAGSELSLGDISPGDTTSVTYYSVTFSENTPGDSDFRFYLAISSGDYAFWSDSFSIHIDHPAEVADEKGLLPTEFALHQNYPNPFNPVSTIRFDLPQGSDVSLVVYDILGREVVRLVDSYIEPGYHQTTWNGRNRLGREVPSGIYIARLVTPGYTKSIKMVLLR